ncbi:MAG: alpha/beta fold hydrolase, partial [Thermodesulfobacteriota bacterium]|nr:alpha/beta fold hydrolase [Thermodesulfobacteriota bacterium]
MAMLYGCSPGRQNGTIEQNHPSPLKASQINETQINKNRDHSVRWFNAESQEKINGVAWVVHGLNLQPDKMGPIISHLNASGIDVLNLSLRGHGQNYNHEPHMSPDKARLDTFKTVSYKQWTDEAYRAYRHARKRSDERKTPLFFIGYSLGALLGGDLLATYPDVHFDRMVLFAPAFNCTICQGLKILAPFPRLVIPSLSSKSYRANRGTPMAAYIALFETIKHFN